MDSEPDIEQLSIEALSYDARNILSRLLDSRKILPTDGPEKLPRDWRGLANLANITSEIAASITSNHTQNVLNIWLKTQNGTATIGNLISYLKRLDRYDVYDDLQDLASKGTLISNGNKTKGFTNVTPVSSLVDLRSNLITIHDVECGSPQFYHAYILYSEEDYDFVSELIDKMTAEGLKLCTENDLQSSYELQHKVVADLISERCHRVIIVCSKAFFNSPKSSFNTYFMTYAQAVGIERKAPKLIPCVYSPCELPRSISYCTKLYYTPPNEKSTYNFWERLSMELKKIDLAALPDSISSPEVKTNGAILASSSHLVASTPSLPSSHSLVNLSSLRARESVSSNSICSDNSTQIKKKSKMSKLFKKMIRGKNKGKQPVLCQE